MNTNFENINITEDLSFGLHSVLYKKINAVNINEARISNVFSRFIREVECSDSFTIMDVFNAAEAVVKGKEPDGNAGNLIFAYDHQEIKNKGILKKLLKHSYSGLYSLLSLNNGLTVDFDSVGNSLSAAETKRFLVAKPSKAQKLCEKAKAGSLNIVKVGEVVTADKVMFTKGIEIIESVDRSVFKNAEKKTVNLTGEHFGAFVSGYNAVVSLVLCNSVSKNNILRIGLGGSFENVFARALGYYSALTYLRIAPVRFIFTPDDNAMVAVGRPNVTDGDYLYLLRVNSDVNGLPDKAHFGQLLYYLAEKKRNGIIKDVLPVGENTRRIINRLCREDLTFDYMAEMPVGAFGIIVSVGRGDSVNGLRLGYFKNI